MNQKGQALVSILLIMAVASLAFAASLVATSLSQTAGRSGVSNNVYFAAESGAEEALLGLLRNPDYSHDTLSINGVNVDITIAKNGTINTIDSEASTSNETRTLEVTADTAGSQVKVLSWKEKP